MAINSLSTANTFFHWLTATNGLITINNNLIDGTLTSNSKIILTGHGFSLNVSNSAFINVLQSNTITANSITTGYLNVYTNVVMSTANVLGTLSVQNLVVRGTQTLTSVTFSSLDITGYVRAAGFIQAGTYFNQLGANARFAGIVDFANTSNSISAKGNVEVFKTLTAANVTLTALNSKLTTPYLTISSSVIGDTNFANKVNITGNLNIAANVTVTSNLAVYGKVDIVKDLTVAGNTKLGPYTEVVNNLGTVTGAGNYLNLKVSSVFRANLNGSTTLTLRNPPLAGNAVSATIITKSLVNPSAITIAGETSTGAAGTLRYSYGTAPVLSSSLNAVNIICAFTIDGGVNWYISAPVIDST